MDKQNCRKFGTCINDSSKRCNRFCQTPCKDKWRAGIKVGDSLGFLRNACNCSHIVVYLCHIKIKEVFMAESQTFRIRGTRARMTSVVKIARYLGYEDNDFVHVVDFALQITAFVMDATRRSALVITDGDFNVGSMAMIPDVEQSAHEAIDDRDTGQRTGREFRDRIILLARHAYAKGLADRALKEESG